MAYGIAGIDVHKKMTCATLGPDRPGNRRAIPAEGPAPGGRDSTRRIPWSRRAHRGGGRSSAGVGDVHEHGHDSRAQSVVQERRLHVGIR